MRDAKMGSIPSFTLLPAGQERSTFILHLFGWCALGIRPIGLVCMPSGDTGPTKLPSNSSFSIYLATTPYYKVMMGDCETLILNYVWLRQN